jgi:ribosome biogenesis protein ENP2
LFEDEEFAVDERSREFQALNPSTKVGENAENSRVGAASDSSESDGEDDEDEIVAQSKVKAKPEMRISSSSYKKSGHQRQDKPLGSRTQAGGRVNKTRGDVVGERQVTFAPSTGRKERDKVEPARKGRRDEGRRSASGNVFRRL